jgi:DNA-binding NarL/FixJ family response regulator
MDGVPIEVLVIDDHLAMRRGVEMLLRAEGLRVAGVAGGLEEARALLERRRHDVALLDVHLGDDSSIELVQEALARNPDAAIVLYTGFTGRGGGLAEAAAAGARGFVLKASSPTRLVDALRSVAAGGTYVDPDLAALLAHGSDPTRVDLLNPREREILSLLADGLTGQAIAETLFLSPETVRTHVRNATTKLGAKTRTQAVAMIVRNRDAS